MLKLKIAIKLALVTTVIIVFFYRSNYK